MLGRGTGRSKKEAQTFAAREALLKLPSEKNERGFFEGGI
jgi:dsRNA-specific ribonuclease